MKDKIENHAISKEDFCGFCRLLYESNLVSGVGGNLSVRADDRILLTPSGYSLRDVTPEAIVTIDEGGRALNESVPTKDKDMHLGILRARPDINVVCHVHGADIIAVSCLAQPGPDTIPPVTPGFVYYAYPLAMIPFMVPGSKDLTRTVTEHFIDSSSSALLMQNHGLVTLGKDFNEALNIAEEIDEAARIIILANGKPKFISKENVAKIKALGENQ